MKRIQSVLLICSLLFLLTACSGGANPSQESSEQTTNPAQQNSEQIKNLSFQQGSISKSEVVSESETMLSRILSGAIPYTFRPN